MEFGFRGTNTEQDNRFSDKEKKLLKTMKFPANFGTKVDFKKIKLPVFRPWISKKVIGILGMEDDVVIDFVCGLLEEEKVDPKQMQIQLTGFLESKTSGFMKELWDLCISASESLTGIPKLFLDQKKEEVRRKKLEHENVIQQLSSTKAAAAAPYKQPNPNTVSVGERTNSRERGNERDRRSSRSPPDRRYRDERNLDYDREKRRNHRQRREEMERRRWGGDEPRSHRRNDEREDESKSRRRRDDDVSPRRDDSSRDDEGSRSHRRRHEDADEERRRRKTKSKKRRHRSPSILSAEEDVDVKKSTAT